VTWIPYALGAKPQHCIARSGEARVHLGIPLSLIRCGVVGAVIKNHDPQRARAEIRGSNWAAFIGHFDLCFKVRDQRFEQQPHPGLWWRVRSELAMFERSEEHTSELQS